MTSPFERLPAEVFDIIAACLDLPEYQSLRLTSQRLHLLTLSTFTKRYFAKLITTLGSPSLDRLGNVASHNHLSQSVTTLEIRLLNHRDYKDLTKIARIGIFPPPKRFPKVSCIRSENIVRESTLHDDVLANRHAKCITERLARGLLGFDNLKAIRFRAHQAEPLEWNATAIPDEDEVFRSRCLRAVFDAVLKSGIALEMFSMGKEKGLAALSKCANVPYPALQLPVEYLQRLRPCLRELDTLTLSIVSQHNGHHRLPGWENSLGRFIATAPGLRHLTLSLDRKCQVSQYGARIIRSLSDSIQIQTLESFHLGNSTFHESDLAKLVKTHAGTLQRLILTNACLLTGNWASLLSSFKAAQRLRCLRLASIDGAGSPVQCRQRDKERQKITLTTGEQEPCMSHLLDELRKAFMDIPVSMYA
ncbi:Protein-lysine N-methyltransferase efm4 [Ascochyta rabiei]|uniref:Methyltransferase n=1 Tax=Didymella rabiei TaxID=5454 RepID=A0A163E1W9_DIDRA|nr:Protein-lysine N-methyltransferase efm4 [Ascochyta rabiei]KZM23467.1 methyltransferase [Ascochyta rabiei]UPX12761.1 Protein-lysine N-methyltransferase efm4 [Ascochyta rabiei]